MELALNKRELLRSSRKELRQIARVKASNNTTHINAAAPKPKPDGERSMRVLRRQSLNVREWMIVFSANQAYIDLPTRLQEFRDKGMNTEQCKVELAAYGPAHPLVGYEFDVSSLSDERLRRLCNAGRWEAAAWHLWNRKCRDKFICADYALSDFFSMPGDPPKGLSGWTGWGGPDVAGMGLDFRPASQSYMF